MGKDAQLTKASKGFRVKSFSPGKRLELSFFHQMSLPSKLFFALVAALLLFAGGIIMSGTIRLGDFSASGQTIAGSLVALFGLVTAHHAFGKEWFQRLTNRLEISQEKGIEVSVWRALSLNKKQILPSQLHKLRENQLLWAESGAGITTLGGGQTAIHELKIYGMVDGREKLLLTIPRNGKYDAEAEVSALNELFATFRDTFREDFVVD